MGEEIIKAVDMYKSFCAKLENLMIEESKLWGNIIDNPQIKIAVISAALTQALVANADFLDPKDIKTVQKKIKGIKS